MEQKRKILVVSGVVILLTIVYGVIYFAYFKNDTVQKTPVTFTQNVQLDDPVNVELGNNVVIGEPLPTEKIKMGDKDVINTYFQLINEQKIAEAHAMRYEKDITIETFKGWYDTVASVAINNMQEGEEHEYHFSVTQSSTTPSKPQEFYRVTMRVHENSEVEVISLEKDFDIYNDLYVGVRTTNAGSKLFLIKNGVESAIVLGEQGNVIRPEENVTFFAPRFVHQGKYVLYGVSGWEFGANVVYDVSAQKEIARFDGADLQFDPQEKYAFACTGAGMITCPGGVVYAMDDLTVPVYELSEHFPTADNFSKTHNPYGSVSEDERYIMNVSCQHDTEKEAIVFELHNDDESLAGTVVYDIRSGKATLKENVK